jgi:hypothetical protein
VVRRVRAGICCLTSKDCVGARGRAHLCNCSKTSSSYDVVPDESIFDPIPLYLLIISFKIWYNDYFIIFRFFQCFSVHLFYEQGFFFFTFSFAVVLGMLVLLVRVFLEILVILNYLHPMIFVVRDVVLLAILSLHFL